MSRLRDLRKERGYSQIKMQMLTGIDQSDYSKLETGKRYYIFTKIENNSYYKGDSFSYSTAVTVSGVRSVIPAKIESVAEKTIKVKKISVTGSDFIYYGISRINSADNVSVWQTENVFSELLPGTDYYVFTKLSNGNTSEDLISDGVHAKTKNTAVSEGKGGFLNDGEGMPVWWIILLVVSGSVLIGATVYILLRKRKKTKKVKLFAKVKDIFVTAFKPIKKDEGHANRTDDDFDFND